MTQTLSITEAARRLAVSEKTVRRRIQRGELTAERAPAPGGFEYRVSLDDQLAETAPHGRTDGGMATDGQHLASETDLGKALEMLRQQIEEKDRQIAELHVLLRQAHEVVVRALPAPGSTGERRSRWWWPFGR
ncbi:MAG: excisionase family DNA-binding protein [Dehalococcoidia bacterium]